jgi:hypothetical protein
VLKIFVAFAARGVRRENALRCPVGAIVTYRTGGGDPPVGEQGMTDEEKQDDKPFTINDRRRFTASGDARDQSDGGGAAHSKSDAAGLTFSGFIIGLAQQAFVCLGLVKDPQTSAVRKDLPQAKAMIDILGMLRDKTQGNLDEVESRMMDEVLDELRLRYVRELRETRSSAEGEKS